MPPAYRAVLFDFDGTLADSYDAITASVNHVAGLHGRPYLTRDQVRGLVGYGLDSLMAELFPDVDNARAVAEYKLHHRAVAEALTQLIPGVREALRRLEAAGLGLAVCSNKAVEFTRDLVAHLEVREYFREVLGPEDVGLPKPAPDMIIEAMRRLGVTAPVTLYVGDMTIDIATARAAGVAVWAAPTGSHTAGVLEAAGPDRLIGSAAELADLLGLPA